MNPFDPAKFLRDEGGSISIEFVIVMPLLLFLVTGGLAYWDAFHSNTQTARVAFAINDIMSRHELVDNTDMTYLYDLELKMLPPDLDETTLRISSVCFNGTGHRVMWSYRQHAEGATDPGALLDEQIPVSILPAMVAQDSVILTEVSARWEPHFLNVGIGSQRWQSALVTRPRFKKFIPHSDLNASNICPAPAP